MCKKKASAKRQNEKTITEALMSDGLMFGRIQQSLGQGGFRVVLNDGVVTTAIPRGLFTSRSFRLSLGDIIILEDSTSGKDYQIIGKMEKKEAHHFYRIGKIAKHIFEDPKDDGDNDSIFDYDDEDDENEKGKKNNFIDLSDEIDIKDI